MKIIHCFKPIRPFKVVFPGWMGRKRTNFDQTTQFLRINHSIPFAVAQKLRFDQPHFTHQITAQRLFEHFRFRFRQSFCDCFHVEHCLTCQP